MLWGRKEEQAEIGRLLDALRAGQGGALVLRGEPGIGKSSLLEDALEHAEGLRVLRARGVAAEATLAYALLQQLLRPLLGQLSALPVPQAGALRVAFGLEASASPPDRFLVSVAALTLLSEAAEAAPLLCVVDDVHWADAPSVEVLGFVARRLDTEPVALLASVRDADSTDATDEEDPGGEGVDGSLAGLRELHLGGLDAASSVALASDRHGLRLTADAGERLVQATGGNPLALLELPMHTPFRWPLPLDGLPARPVPVGRTLEQAFLARVRRHPPEVQRVLLVAAAEGAGRLRTVRAAVKHLGLDPDVLETGELGDLIGIGPTTVSFRHALVRSAVYHGASRADRREAHRALAEALGSAADTDDDPAQADRRAWHRAYATDGTDEEVARDLEVSAERALQRSGHTAAAAAFKRAALLSPAAPDRVRRLVATAASAWRSGNPDMGRAMLAEAQRAGPAAAEVQLDLDGLRGLIELRAGVPAEALAILLPAARNAVAVDPSRAVRLLAHAGEAAFRTGRITVLEEMAEICGALPPDLDPPDALMMRLLDAALKGASAAATRDDLAKAGMLDDPDLLLRAGGLARWGLQAYDAARRLGRKGMELARWRGAAGTLAPALHALATDEFLRGRFAFAEAHAREGRDLAEVTGQPVITCEHEALLAGIVALRGHEAEARELAERVLTEATWRGLANAALYARRALVYLALTTGHVEETLWHLDDVSVPGPPGNSTLCMDVIPDLVEAATRARQPVERVGEAIADLTGWVESTGSPDARALVARTHALLASGEEADRRYQHALSFHAAGDRPFDRARTQLLYGEFLRRGRRRADARPYLREALETFERLGTPLWAERARSELRATAETIRPREPDGLTRLTPQELQVVRAVAQGVTNRGAAAQLFLSPRTVDYHLRKVYRHLGISSRAELIRLAVTGDALDDAAADPKPEPEPDGQVS